jgi:hypothetical protein
LLARLRQWAPKQRWLEPVALPHPGRSARALIEVSYMACGPTGCLPPVAGKQIPVSIAGR